MPRADIWRRNKVEREGAGNPHLATITQWSGSLAFDHRLEEISDWNKSGCPYLSPSLYDVRGMLS